MDPVSSKTPTLRLLPALPVLRLIRFLSFALSLAVASAAQTLHVDPARGVDLPGRGGPGAPFRSLTFAVGQAAPFATFVLAPGYYERSNGEVWPIDLPDLATVRGDDRPGGGRVVFDAAAQSGPLFRVVTAGNALVSIEDLEVVGDRGALLEVRPTTAAAFATVTLRRCRSSLPLGCRFLGGSGALDVIDSTLDTDSGAIVVDADFPATVQLRADRCRLTGGVAVVDLDATGGGAVTARFRATEFLAGAVHGLRVATDRSGTAQIGLEHVLFARCGLGAGASTRGAAIETVAGGTGVVPAIHVANSVFARNAHDAPAGGAGCTFGINLVEQADLVGAGANVLGRARFVDPVHGDWRLTPTSPGVGQGDVAAVSLWVDRDGRPRDRTAPDLGPNEVLRHAVHSIGDTRPGGRWEFALTSDSGAPFGIVVGTARRPNGFGVGEIHVDGVLVPTTLAGTCDGDGVGRFSLLAPADPALVGLELYWQAFAGRVPELGANAWRTIVRP